MKTLLFILFGFLNFPFIYATDYHVGLGQPMITIAEVPWATLQAGDRVFIHWKNTPYKEKWVINRQGTAANRIEIIGLSGPNGEQPVIDGNGAVTPTNLSYWNESRGVIKIGGSSVPADGLPAYITIDNLEIKSGQPDYQFTDDNGNTDTYTNNAAAIYVEKAANLIIRNCTLHDAGNGLFIGASGGQTQHILIEKNHIYDNGIVGRFFEHNAYTEAIDIIYQYNHFGPLRTGAGGNNLKDRSAGLVVRYNWIEGGNRQLDMVDSEDSPVLVNHSSYSTTHVYGNILIEPDGAGNSQIAHYGGDSGATNNYRKGNLYFYNNTVISTRTGNTTLVRLSTNGETADVFNNVIYTTASGGKFAMIDDDGTFNMHHNWLKTGWKDCHCSPTGAVNDMGNNLTGSDPLFENFGTQAFKPQENSSLINQGDALPALLLPDNNAIFEYIKHQDFENKTITGNIDIGAYEYNNGASCDNIISDNSTKASYQCCDSLITQGTVVVTNSTTFEAGIFIRLNPGFSTNPNSYFLAFINACSSLKNSDEPLERNLNSERPLKMEHSKLSKINLTYPFLDVENDLTIYPNPFNLKMNIAYKLNASGIVWMGLHDLTGRVIKVLVPQTFMQKGEHQLTFQSHQLLSGTYWISIRTENQVITKKIIILK